MSVCCLLFIHMSLLCWLIVLSRPLVITFTGVDLSDYFFAEMIEVTHGIISDWHFRQMVVAYSREPSWVDSRRRLLHHPATGSTFHEQTSVFQMKKRIPTGT